MCTSSCPVPRSLQATLPQWGGTGSQLVTVPTPVEDHLPSVLAAGWVYCRATTSLLQQDKTIGWYQYGTYFKDEMIEI